MGPRRPHTRARNPGHAWSHAVAESVLGPTNAHRGWFHGRRRDREMPRRCRESPTSPALAVVCSPVHTTTLSLRRRGRVRATGDPRAVDADRHAPLSCPSVRFWGPTRPTIHILLVAGLAGLAVETYDPTFSLYLRDLGIPGRQMGVTTPCRPRHGVTSHLPGPMSDHWAGGDLRRLDGCPGGLDFPRPLWLLASTWSRRCAMARERASRHTVSAR